MQAQRIEGAVDASGILLEFLAVLCWLAKCLLDVDGISSSQFVFSFHSLVFSLLALLLESPWLP